MTRISIIILIISFFLIPDSGETAMNALSNNSLSCLKAGGSDLSDQELSASISDKQDTNNQKKTIKKTDKHLRDKTQLHLFRKSRDYQTFLNCIKKLNLISERKMYHEVVNSKNFLVLCSKFARISDTCDKRLFSLIFTQKNNTEKSILSIHRELFRQANLFYKLVYQYQKEKNRIPDINQFLKHVKVGLNTIEAEYAEL